jgi:parallel beta-helix repeat protein
LVGTVNSIVSGNLISGNADGVLISDETAESELCPMLVDLLGQGRTVLLGCCV